jgi:hypothetical protein
VGCVAPPAPALPSPEPETPARPAIDIDPDDLETVIRRDGIQAITDPQFATASSAVAGSLEGEPLRVLTSAQPSWQDRIAEPPDTAVLSKRKSAKVFQGTANGADSVYDYAADP